MKYYFFLPNSLNVYYLKFKKYFVLITLGTKYFWFTIDKDFLVKFDKEIRIISITSLLHFNVFNNYLTKINFFIFSWVSLLSKKIKFKHKGAWITIINKKFKLIILNFRLAHITYLFNNHVMLKRRKKHFSFHTLLCLGYNLKSMIKLTNVIYSFFSLNKFTFRGIKLSRQRLIKKEGKVSKYMIDLKK